MSTINISFRGNIFLVEGTAGRDDKRLLEKFMNDSNPNVRPVKNIEDQVNVTFDITLHGVIEMDEKHQILSTSVWIRQVRLILLYNLTLITEIKESTRHQ
ncbi:hypothetical protein OS493_008845 [Desmophyllum pertusum]|uniref:Neurotransmitter-gated ion-channel ligand-binding domain-containing protein n=1 Tax=Desmophyllum pertusum TaxID=174260 RepID=A0A9W9ZG34_9CNID|nr:hypothetical protein OS493_008845 [Desmophyllum pertusum]